METENILYHYTNFESLDSILRNEELRVNNVLNMNDAMEMRLFMKGLSKSIQKELKEKGLVKEAQYIQNLFLDAQKNEFVYSSYAACFSSFRDDASQWERYGNKGKGVCIAFRKDMLEKIMASIACLEKVYYQDNMDQHYLVKQFLENIHNEEIIKELMKEAWICSAAFKHPSFASENETRLLVTPFAENYFNVKPKYHITSDRIKKYYPLNLKRMGKEENIDIKDLVEEIIIGPESTQSLPILQDYLKDNGKDYLIDRVSLSSCPLRKTSY